MGPCTSRQLTQQWAQHMHRCKPTFCLGWEITIVFAGEMHEYTSRILLWVRFLDDLFISWDGSILLFNRFVEVLNVNRIGVYFTSEIQKRHQIS